MCKCKTCYARRLFLRVVGEQRTVVPIVRDGVVIATVVG